MNHVRSEAEIEVAGTPEEVWAAIATGPGISSWYVPHEVEERAGGAMHASFGPGMDVAGRVAAWDPPTRVVFDGGEGVGGLAFEWMVEARDGGTCVVRLVNSGFGSGDDWDDQYDAMTEGWRLFMFNLRLHLEHFGGRAGNSAAPDSDLGPTAGGRVDRTHAPSHDRGQPEAWATRSTSVTPDGLGLDGHRGRDGEPQHFAGARTSDRGHGVHRLQKAPASRRRCRSGRISMATTGPTVAERDAPRWSAWLDANAPSAPS